LTKEFTAKEKLEIVLSAPVQSEAGGRGVWGEFCPPSPAISVRIFSNRHRLAMKPPLAEKMDRQEICGYHDRDLRNIRHYRSTPAD